MKRHNVFEKAIKLLNQRLDSISDYQCELRDALYKLCRGEVTESVIELIRSFLPPIEDDSDEFVDQSAKERRLIKIRAKEYDAITELLDELERRRTDRNSMR